jgi:hypothetical protein
VDSTPKRQTSPATVCKQRLTWEDDFTHRLTQASEETLPERATAQLLLSQLLTNLTIDVYTGGTKTR